MAATLARAAAQNSRQGASGTLTITETIGDGETGALLFLQTWDSAGGSAQHTISGIVGGGAWSLHDGFTWNDGTLRRRIEWWKTAPGAAVAAASVVVSFAAGTAPLVEGVTVWPVAGAVAFGTMARALGTGTADAVTLSNMLDNDNLMLSAIFNGDSSSVLTQNVGTSDTVMNPGAVSDFYCRTSHNTRATPGTLTISVTDALSNTWWATAIELRTSTAIKRAKFAHLNSSQTVGATTAVQALANIAPDSLVVVGFTYDNSKTLSTLRDDLAVDGALGKLFNDPNFAQVYAIYYFKDYGGGDRTFTATYSGAAAWRDMWVIEYLGADLTAPKDGNAQQNSGSSVTSFNSGNLTPAPSVDGTLIVGICEGTGGNIPTPASPFVDIVGEAVTSHDMADYVQPTAAAIAAGWTQPSGAYSALAVSFKPAVVTVPPVTSPPLQYNKTQPPINQRMAA